jgi:hypothetical protein
MKLSLLIALVGLVLAGQPQTETQKASDIVVLKFRCGRYEATGHMIRSVQEPDPPMNEPIRINQIKNNEPQEVISRRDLQERREQMKAAEINAARSAQPQSTLYFYHLEVRNTSLKVVKSFAWSYQPGESPDPSDRQFYCVVKAKPSEAKEFNLYAPLAPSRVVEAAKASDKSKANSIGSVVINKIEYMDGSVWKRPGWNPATFTADATEKVVNGKCIGL